MKYRFDLELGNQNGKKFASRQDRVEIFEDTMEWIKSDTDLSDSVKKAKANTQVYYENDYPVFDSSKEQNEEIVITKNRSFQAAMDLVKENPNAKVAVLNFANAFHAGGGVTRGASAQEECLCRCSTL